MENSAAEPQQVTLVDKYDHPLGDMEKMEAHEKGLLHRAVSVFLFNPHGEWLLQRRAFSKYHSGGLWSNACCTHPGPHETPAEAAARRLPEELGITCPLEPLFRFIYRAELDHGLIEHEYDHIYVGCTTGLPQINPQEIAEWGYFSPELLACDMQVFPGNYTPWFRHLFPEVLKRQSTFTWNASV